MQYVILIAAVLIWGGLNTAEALAGNDSQTVCKLVLRGYGGGRSNKTGVSWAQLECLPQGQQPVAVILDESHLNKFAPTFQGVSCLEISAAVTAALISFCGNEQLLLEQPVIEGVLMERAHSNTSERPPALLLFGGSINVNVTNGRLQRNAGRPASRYSTTRPLCCTVLLSAPTAYIEVGVV
jgi:hypothetical protein